MTQFLSLLLNGLSLGAIYALIALGFVIIFKASEVVSFMQGSLLLLGAYLIARFHETLGFWGAAAVGIARHGGCGRPVVERVLINRLRGAPVISLAILTIGVDLIMLTELTRRIGSDILNVGHPWGGESISLGGVGITTNRAIAILVAAVLIAAFFAAFKYSSWGVAMRAAAEDGEAAALMGIRLGRVSSAGLDDRRRARRRRRSLPRRCTDARRDPAVATVALRCVAGGDPRRPRLDRRRPGRRPADRRRRVAGRRLPGPDLASSAAASVTWCRTSS